MKYAQDEVQQAIDALLRGDGTLTALLPDRSDAAGEKAIMDYVPQNQTYPYVTIGDHTSDPFRTMTRPGEDLIEMINIYSQSISPKVYLKIADAIQALMGDVTGATFPSVTGHFVIASYFAGSQRFKTQDSPGVQTVRLEMRYRITTQDTAAF